MEFAYSEHEHKYEYQHIKHCEKEGSTLGDPCYIDTLRWSCCDKIPTLRTHSALGLYFFSIVSHSQVYPYLV